MEKQIIKSIRPIETSPSGWSSIKVTLADNREGEILLGKDKNTHLFKEGMEIVFIPESSQYGLKLKHAKPADAPSGNGGGRPKVNEAAISANVALAEAVKLVIADKVKIADIIPTADKLYDWIKVKGGF